MRDGAREAAVERVLDVLLPRPQHRMGFSTDEPVQPRDTDTRNKLRQMLDPRRARRPRGRDRGALANGGVDPGAPGMEEMQQQLQSVLSNLGGNRTRHGA